LSDNVRILPGFGKRDPNALLQTAQAAALDSVVIIGWNAAGEMFISHSHDDYPNVLWDIKQAERFICAPDE